MSLARRLFYSRPVNATLRRVIGPLRHRVPEGWRFPVHGVIRIPLEKAAPLRLRVNPTSYQGKQFFWEGAKGFEPSVHTVFRILVTRSRGFLDVGANLGLYSLLARAYNPDVHIMAFEPLPDAHAFLLQNLALNNVSGCTALPLALSNETGTATFHAPFNAKFDYLKAHLGGTGSLDAAASNVNKRAVSVTTQRLDTLMASHQSQPIDLIKLDTEGTEDRVLRGAEDTIQKHRPFLLCEVLPGRTERALDIWMERMNYVAFGLTSQGIMPVRSLHNDRLDGNDYLFCPSENVEMTVHLLPVAPTNK